jgi:hypothetical protein
VNIDQEPLEEAVGSSEKAWRQWPEEDRLERSDHIPFREAGVPSLLIRWCGSEETNKPLEEADTVDPDSLAVSGRVLSLLMMTLAQ